MPQIAIGLLTGILILCSLSSLPNIAWSVLIPVLPVLALRYRKPRLLFAVIGGFLWALFQAHMILQPQLPASVEKQDLLITGKVISIPESSKQRIRFDFAPDQVIESPVPLDLPDKIRLSWYYSDASVQAGEHWQLLVRLKRPHGFMNPGGFDYEAYLFQQHVTATGYIRKDSRNARLTEAGLSLNGLRQSLAEKISHVMEGSSMTGLVQALVLGLRSNIASEQWELFIASGTNHLIAISGLHIGLLSGLGFWLGGWCWRRSARCCLWLPAPKAAAIIGWLFALGYAALAGFSIPTQRALIMVSVVMLALVTQRTVKPMSTLSTSLVLVLLWDSFAVLSAGFWLSFFAVMMIVWMLGNRQHWKAWQQWGFMQSGLALALLPLTVWFFQRVSLIAPVANFLVVPVVAFFVVPLVLLATVLLIVSEQLAGMLFQLAAATLQMVVWLLDYLARLPFSNLYLAEPSWITGLLALVAAVLLFAPRGIVARGLSTVLFLPILLQQGDTIESGAFRVHFLDVGQGLSVVVQTAQHTLLFDTGARFSDSFNAGEAVVVPFLHSQGIRQLDHIMISHADNDHRGGLESVIKAMPAGKISSSDPESLADIVNAGYCIAGQSWRWDDVVFTVLHPERDWQGGRNNRACVLRIENNNSSVLLTADIEKEAEKALLQTYGDALKATVLLVPHHGSRTSSHPAFIASVDPDYAVLTTGYLNRFGFPKPDVMSRYEQRDIDIHHTLDSGSMRLDFTRQGKISFQHYRSNHARFWHFKPF